MASIKKRNGSEIWQAQFYVTDQETGEIIQVRKSTKQRSKRKAMLAAVEMERAARGTMESGSDKAQKAKALLADAVAEIERETFTPATARKLVADLLAIATGEEMPAYTVETWIEEWLRRKKRDKASKATMARYKGHLDGFLDWLGDARRKRPLESVTTAMVRSWRESLQDGGRAGKTVLGYTKDLGAVYRAAIREGLTNYNPAAALETVATDDSLDRKPFTGAEVAALLGAAPSQEWRGLILVAAFTGLRLGDASRLAWDAVDLEAKRITLIPSKTKRKKREVRIPIQEDLLTYLLAAPVAEDDPSAPVFPALSKTSIGARSGLSQTFNKIMAKAGVDRGKPSRTVAEGENKGAGRITYERGFHSLRHTFTSWPRNAGVSEEDRMALTGHTTRESHAIYSHHDEAALRDAVAKLPGLKGGGQ